MFITLSIISLSPFLAFIDPPESDQQKHLSTFLHPQPHYKSTSFWRIIIRMIKKLPKEVINKIAAGEVIQRPYNVIKELVENAIDADATQIRVNILNGGLSTIEILDNGKGIRKADFPLLCERFATSKIAQLSDLQTISSFGFRGEALASLSYVSQLQITSKHKDENIGYRCSFKDQKMMEEPQPISTNTGTKIKASQLFGNLQTRRSSLNPGEEKKRIIRLISHFSLHYHLIKFSVESQKGQEFSTDFRGLSVSKSKMKVFQLITKLSYDKFTYLPKDILEDIKIQGIITKLNTIKGKTLLLNVNNRIVQNPDILKLVERGYSECYQSIHEENEGFFVYLSIQLDSKKIDCNQHPSKKTIGFFGADKIYENIYGWVLASIKEESSIKNIATNIVTKGKVPFNVNKNMILNIKNQGSQPPENTEMGREGLLKRPQQSEMVSRAQQKEGDRPVYAFNKNRTDALQIPINFYMKNKESSGGSLKELRFNLKADEKEQHLSQNIKKFFQCISYVGCFNLNFIFIHIENCLYLMNILPCLESYIREWLQNNSLIIAELVDQTQQLDLRTIITRFLSNKRLEGRIDVDQVIDKILLNKYLLAKEFGIAIEQKNNSLEGTVISFPVFERFMADSLNVDELAYFLCRLFAKEPSSTQREDFFIEFLTTFFQESDGDVGEGGRMDLSPLNDLYSQYFRDKVIPVLKTKGKDYKEINFTEYLTQMVNMKHVYKIFQRC